MAKKNQKSPYESDKLVILSVITSVLLVLSLKILVHGQNNRDIDMTHPAALGLIVVGLVPFFLTVSEVIEAVRQTKRNFYYSIALALTVLLIYSMISLIAYGG